MNSAVEKAAATYVAPKVLKNFRFSWLLYGVGAYYGLKYLNKRGIMPNQTGAALNFIDKGIDMAKRRVGFAGSQNAGSQAQQSLMTH